MEDKNSQSLVFIESVNMFHFTNSSRDYLYPPTPAVQIKQWGWPQPEIGTACIQDL